MPGEVIITDQAFSIFVTFIHFEKVEVKRGVFDTVQTNRQESRSDDQDVVHIRTIYQCHPNCRPLEAFADDAENLAAAIKDVIIGLTQIYQYCNLVHGDIVPWNILVQPTASKRFRGVLIDFTFAQVKNSSVLGSQAQFPTRDIWPPPVHNAQMFMHHDIWPSGIRTPKYHLEDIQPCYFILYELSGDLLLWVIADARAARRAKTGHFLLEFDINLRMPPDGSSSPQHLKALAIDLHTFFRQRYLDALAEAHMRGTEGRKLPTKSFLDDYRELLINLVN
ncbi:hypothetical protein M422DRAFT_250559 [Sphaerobolus stellatus SS14]|uniref:Fungal-type protein kinase domain-containing protein n=1 Tax=Sphaerobolus stellatus (strain SS14) TaxID=990650 RepID=A0A0C9W474_SPHS4|nr:hypothetical protein M422DRAFT_250559 [Sphaerobolus stellatus SS14]